MAGIDPSLLDMKKRTRFFYFITNLKGEREAAT
jgi:hypothetical protein